MAKKRATRRPTFSSVTLKPCKCGYLQRAADDPDLPIVFDTRLNEYNFEYRERRIPGQQIQGKATLRIYHCPFCGGAAPKSKRHTLFAAISASECERLRKVIRGIKSLGQALKRLGPADRDEPEGVTRKYPGEKGQPPRVVSFRTLVYTRLSDSVELHITDFRDGSLHFRLQGKYIGQKK